jgi:hypothetical protein
MMEAARWLRGAAAQEELEAVGVLEAAEGALEVFGWWQRWCVTLGLNYRLVEA